MILCRNRGMMMNEKREVFISYHTSSAIDIVKKLVAALEGAGISCWYAPRDCEEDFAESIVRAIRGCRVFLFVLNRQSGNSEHCKNEVSQAFSRYSAHDRISFLPYMVESCRLSDGLSYYMNRFHIMDGGTPPEDLKITELIGRVKTILSKEDFREAEVEIAVAPGEMDRRSCRILSAMQYPDTGFVGRDREITEISEQLAQTDNKVILVGMGGMGKSEIAKMYLKRHAQDFDVVRWVPFEESLIRTIASDTALPIEGISRDDWKSDSDEDYAARKLHILETIADRRVLLIIDNYDVQGDQWFARLCEGRFALIFTTRYHQRGSGIREIEILPMTDENELLDLFRAEYKRSITPEEEQAVREIISFLEGHTLSIRLIASAMQARRIKPDKMLDMLRADNAALKDNGKLADLIYGRLKSVFSLSALSDEELFVMKNLSLIPMSGIEVETFSEWCGADFDEIDALIDKNWLVHDPVADKIHLHPLVTDLMLEELEKDPDACISLLEHMTEAFRNTFRRSYAERQQKVDFLNTVCARLPETHPLYEKMLLIKADAVMNNVGFKAVIDIYRKLWDSRPENIDLAEICGKYAHALELSGDLQGTYDIASQGWEMIKDIPMESMTNHHGYWCGQITRRLLCAAREMGDYEAAVQWGKTALEFAGRFYTTTLEESRGWALWHNARTYYLRSEAGDLEKSEEMIREADRLFEKDNDEWSRSFCFGQLGLILMKQGKFQDALDNIQMYMDILLPRLGSDHYDIAQGYEWYAEVYTAMGDTAQAADSYQKAIEIYHKNGAGARQKAAQEKLDALGLRS